MGSVGMFIAVLPLRPVGHNVTAALNLSVSSTAEFAPNRLHRPSS